MSGSGPAGDTSSSSSSSTPDPAPTSTGESNSSCANSSSRKPDPAPPPNPSQQPEAAPDTPPPTWTVWYRPPERDWVPAFWAQQSRGAYAYDMASCALKVVLLIGNVKRSLDHGQLHAARCAAGERPAAWQLSHAGCDDCGWGRARRVAQHRTCMLRTSATTQVLDPPANHTHVVCRCCSPTCCLLPARCCPAVRADHRVHGAVSGAVCAAPAPRHVEPPGRHQHHGEAALKGWGARAWQRMGWG